MQKGVNEDEKSKRRNWGAAIKPSSDLPPILQFCNSDENLMGKQQPHPSRVEIMHPHLHLFLQRPPPRRKSNQGMDRRWPVGGRELVQKALWSRRTALLQDSRRENSERRGKVEAEERETDRRRKGNALRGIVTYYQERNKRMIGHKEGAARDARRVQGRAS